MDAVRLGRAFRALRIRQSRSQGSLAESAGLSRSIVSRVERGDVRHVDLGAVDALAIALGAELDVRVRWRGEGLDRLLDQAHAQLVDALVRRLVASSWETAVEVSFNVWGERGSIDVLGLHPATGALVVCEVKSVIADAQGTISTLDRKARLGRTVAAERGWHPATVSRLLVAADSTTTRRRVAALGAIFGTAFPARGAAVRTWLRSPTEPISGLLFAPDALHRGIRRPAAGRERANPGQAGRNRTG